MKLGILPRLTDWFVLQPSTNWIAAENLAPQKIPFADGFFELWSHLTHEEEKVEDLTSSADLFILKFPGTGGRAERSTNHPADWWHQHRCAVFVVNPPGYGGSTGRASLQTMADVSLTAYDAVAKWAGDRPIVLTGNSLGAVAALTVAARRRVRGLLLRNPPALREVIMGRFGRWTLGVGARLIARQTPAEICSIENASRSQAAAVFVTSSRDRVVPPRFQQAIIDKYAGQKKVLRLAEADHHTPMTEEEQQEYGELLDWLVERL